MTALIRNLVPTFWGMVVTALLSWGLITPDIAEIMQGWAVPITGAVVLLASAVVHQLAQKMIQAPWFPNWIARLFAGSIKQPSYDGGHVLGVTRYRRGDPAGPLNPSEFG